MTRVEKFHDYRLEISKMKVEEVSVKSETSKMIGEITKTKQTSSLGYNEIMNPLELFDENAKNHKKLYKFKLTLDQFLYGLVASIVIGFLILLVVVLSK